MKSHSKEPVQLPLSWVSNSAKRSKWARVLLDHLHLTTIAEDHQYEFVVCTSDQERMLVVARARRQAARATARVAGMDSALHGVFLIATEYWVVGIAVAAAGAAAAYLFTD